MREREREKEKERERRKATEGRRFLLCSAFAQLRLLSLSLSPFSLRPNHHHLSLSLSLSSRVLWTSLSLSLVRQSSTSSPARFPCPSQMRKTSRRRKRVERVCLPRNGPEGSPSSSSVFYLHAAIGRAAQTPCFIPIFLLHCLPTRAERAAKRAFPSILLSTFACLPLCRPYSFSRRGAANANEHLSCLSLLPRWENIHNRTGLSLFHFLHM